MNSTRVWGIRAGMTGQADSIFLGSGQIALASSELETDVGALPPTRGAFKEAFRNGAGDRAASAQAGQLFRFVHEIQIGDRVIYPRRQDRTLRWGEIAGPYVFEAGRIGEFAHRRAVRWTGKVSRDEVSQAALYELGSLQALFEVKSFATELWARFEGDAASLLTGEAPETASEATLARDIVDSTRDFIARKLKVDLKGHPFEGFIVDLFRAMGYRARATRPTRDDGIDVIAHRDELGVEPPIYKIQAKVNESRIGADCVKAFFAGVLQREIGVFITTGEFTSSALDFARDKGNLRLVNGVELVDLVQKYYEQLDGGFRRLIPLRRVFVPDVADAA